jgi:hypothetical protein
MIKKMLKINWIRITEDLLYWLNSVPLTQVHLISHLLFITLNV